MSAWNYYMPLWGGIILGVIFAVNGYQTTSGSDYIIKAAAYSLLFGVWCQLSMIGFQGTSAQVLPVPVGKSIRGRGASVTGGLILTSCALAVGTIIVSFQGIAIGTTIGIVALSAFGLTAAISYFWCAATAIADFGARE